MKNHLDRSGGARAWTPGLVFYDAIYLDDGSFSSHTGMQVGMLKQQPRQNAPHNSRYSELNTATQRTRLRDAIRRRIASRDAERMARRNAGDKALDSALSILYIDTVPALQLAVAAVANVGIRAYYPGYLPPEQRFLKESPAPVGTISSCRDGDPVYTYDVLDRVSSMISPVGTTQYEYEPVSGRLAAIVSPEGKRFAYGYDRGQLETITRPNGVVTHYEFDENGNLELLDHRLGVNSVARFEYGYDRNGMRTSMTDLDGLHEYGYDTLYQLVNATHPTVSNPLEQFQYDAAGNRLADAYRSAYQYNELNQLVEDDSCVYAYDVEHSFEETSTHFILTIHTTKRFAAQVDNVNARIIGMISSKPLNTSTGSPYIQCPIIHIM